MARIRTIKPEFPQSESVGKLSRDARLLFIQLWTIVDDEGRTRAASRMLASLLYPYDDDASGLIGGWLSELASARMIARYEVDGSQYLQITKWLEHQKIDRPSKSRLPPPTETLASPREPSRALDADLGPRTKDLGPVDDDGDAGAREMVAVIPIGKPEPRKSLISDEAKQLADRLLVIAGHSVDPLAYPPGWCGAAMRVQTWLSDGWPEEIIIAAVTAAAAKKRDGPASSVQYFERAIAAEAARQSAPLPKVEIQPSDPIRITADDRKSTVIQAADNLIDTIRNFDEMPRTGDGERLRSRTGSASPRLLSQG